MSSLNFEVLRQRKPQLAELGTLAEAYCYTDIGSAAVKLRIFAEELVREIYSAAHLKKPEVATFDDLLRNQQFQKLVPRAVLNQLFDLKREGNRGAHQHSPSNQSGLASLRIAYDLAAWYAIAYCNFPRENIPVFKTPPVPGSTNTASNTNTNEDLERRLEEHEKALAALLKSAQREQARTASQPTSGSVNTAQIANNTKVAAQLNLSEAGTRKRLIDTELIDANWHISDRGDSNNEVGLEVEVDGQPTPSGKGFADYVLWGDDGKPLAVIEAKKTARSAELGREQAKLYADSLERKYGQRPVIFYTNGFDIYIWDDVIGEPPRRINGFYSRESLQYRVFRRSNLLPLNSIPPDDTIIDRLYQIEAIRTAQDHFENKHRSALFVMATGTGKTRVAIALCEALIRANSVKRILFLCDRNELRKQAFNTFKTYLPAEPRIIVSKASAQDRNHRIYLATYPAMNALYQSFDVGFFDLVILDESHRSIYNKYRDLLLYFDALRLGLTATPVNLISRNTFQLFGCADMKPTFEFSLDEALNHSPPYLAPFEVIEMQTGFQRKGIRYADLSAEQRQQLEDSGDAGTDLDVAPSKLDRDVFNKSTTRAMIRNLMEDGIRDRTGTLPGKTIIFARSHRHAVALQAAFDELYPQYAGVLCRIIDQQDARAEELIDEFKGLTPDPKLRIAISVDMLDTGVDVPEVVNLVFAKPVRSYVKFWQMIGRGTRLCANLFGRGKDKTHFLIFDHWANFRYFGESYKPAISGAVRSIAEILFQSRIDAAEASLVGADIECFALFKSLIASDLATLERRSIAVREKWEYVAAVSDVSILDGFSPNTVNVLRREVAPLMRWRQTTDAPEATNFDIACVKAQLAKLRGSSEYDDLADLLVSVISGIDVQISEARAQSAVISAFRQRNSWDKVSVQEIEDVRKAVRGVVKFQRGTRESRLLPPTILDIAERAEDVQRGIYRVTDSRVDDALFRQRLGAAITRIQKDNSVLKKISEREALTVDDLTLLRSDILAIDDSIDISRLESYYGPDVQVDQVIRGFTGSSASVVKAAFARFIAANAPLTPLQARFLDLLQSHVTRFGGIELDRLYEPPFTALSAAGVEGIFDSDKLMDDLLALLVDLSSSTIIALSNEEHQ